MFGPLSGKDRMDVAGNQSPLGLILPLQPLFPALHNV
jgi:hypothetical protein